jgi:osmoprotectant transport system substrate-binding protein
MNVKMRNWSAFVVLLTLMGVITAACSSNKPSASSTKSGPTIIVGSSNVAENVTLAEVYAQALEAKGYKVQRKLNLGAREIVEPALVSGQLSFLPEYLNSDLEFYNNGKGDAEVQRGLTTLRSLIEPKGLVALDAASAQDKNEFGVTQATAQKYSLRKISDLKPVANKLILGGPPECPTRPLCLKGLQQTYGIHFKQFKPLDVGGPLTIAALKGDKIDVGLLFTTLGALVANKFVLLQDDKGLQGAENVVPVTRKSIVDAYGTAFTDLIDSISAKVDVAAVQEMNKETDIDKKDPKDAARDFLVKNGFVSA